MCVSDVCVGTYVTIRRTEKLALSYLYVDQTQVAARFVCQVSYPLNHIASPKGTGLHEKQI